MFSHIQHTIILILCFTFQVKNMSHSNKLLLNGSENLKLRNAVTREDRLPLLSVSGVSHHWSQNSRAVVSRVACLPMPSFPRSGAEAQNTLALRKSSIFGNPRPGQSALKH